MTTQRESEAHDIVATFESDASPGEWRLDRTAVGLRLHELVENPWSLRQGGHNLCGPAALLGIWLGRDPVAAVTYAVELFRQGHAALGTLEIVASRALRELAYSTTPRAEQCPQADWMMMAGLRDSANRTIATPAPAGCGRPRLRSPCPVPCGAGFWPPGFSRR